MAADKDYVDVNVVVPHEVVANVECCGCLVAMRSGENAEIRCNECDALIETVPLNNLEATEVEQRAIEIDPEPGSVPELLVQEVNIG
jgi:hypothetical protein